MESMERRHFLTGLAALGGGALLTAVGCTPKKPDVIDGGDTPAPSGDTTPAVTPEDPRKAAYEAAQAPIPPVQPPATWDEETEVIVVGSGGGGCFCAIRLGQAGYKVMMLERNAELGGNTKYGANVFANWGGHKGANEAQWAYPVFPYDPEKVVEAQMEQQGFTGDPELLLELAKQGPKCIDWMTEKQGWVWHGNNPSPSAWGQMWMWDVPVNWADPDTWNVAKHFIRMDLRTPIYEARMKEVGVDIRLKAEVIALVQDASKRIVGVKAKIDGAEKFIKATRAVALEGGGFEVNRALMKKYCPRATAGIANIATPPNGTGELFRMGLGVGAAVSGFDSTGSFEGGIWWQEYDEYDTEMLAITHNTDGNTVIRQPWLRINKFGQRVPYFSTRGTSYPWNPAVPVPAPGMYVDPAGLCDQACNEMAQPDGKTYVIFDDKWHDLLMAEHFGEMICRMCPPAGRPGQPESEKWDNSFYRCVENGGCFKCDTIEELEQKLGLRKGLLVEEVKKWNEACAKGEDYAPAFKYPKAWLNAIDKPPYYGAITGANPFGTKCGLRINTKMQVVTEDGPVVEGLYAGWHTAGGSSGDSNLGGRPQTGVFADGALSYIGGYMVAGAIMAEDGKTD